MIRTTPDPRPPTLAMPAAVDASHLFENSGETSRICVRWLLNPGQAPEENCCLTITAGVVADIRPCRAGDRIQPLAVIPPLVNAHTHLEFSSLQQPFSSAGTFPDWIGRVLAWRGQVSMEQSERIRAGVQESRQAGVRLAGDILTGRHSATNLSAWQGVSAVLFREVIALTPERFAGQLSDLHEHLRAVSVSAAPAERLVAGISPHAPYTVHPQVLQELVRLACQYQAPLAMHLAETAEELELLQCGTGPFAELLQRLGVWDSRVFPGGRDPQELLEQLQVAPRSLVVHGNYLSDGHIRYLARHPQLTVVYCPRTHAWFRHPPHPFCRMRQAGVSVVLGTDGRSTNPDLSIFRELQSLLRQYPDLDIQDVLGMVTTAAAEALGVPEVSRPIVVGQPWRATLLRLPTGVSGLAEICRHENLTVMGLDSVQVDLGG